MADHHQAKDGSKRNTYTHCIGHQLADGNTGKMQWGEDYRIKHSKIYRSICPLISENGLFVLNISNHIRKGEEIDVAGWHVSELEKNGFHLVADHQIATTRNRFGSNSDKRVDHEHIYVLRKEVSR